MLKTVRYGKVFYFNKASLYSGKSIDAKHLSLCADVPPPSEKNREKSPDFGVRHTPKMLVVHGALCLISSV